jgi:hypothetical protein
MEGSNDQGSDPAREPVEHRGVVISPLFPRRTPVVRYVTLGEALPLGFRVTEVEESGVVPEPRW